LQQDGEALLATLENRAPEKSAVSSLQTARPALEMLLP
jgi:hypothetical protein